MFPCSLRDLAPDVLIEDKIEVACEHDVLRPARKTGPLTRELYWQIGECGWLGSAYPKEYGGQLSKFIAEEEFIRAGVSIDLGVSGAPPFLRRGQTSRGNASSPDWSTATSGYARIF
ncbi:acyl-CoA dehydrogenase family protein [Burkholderia sp. WP9]|uniref:acyl-CoA dehydrogenase family protein n=1 Tax=Burkholderia sp. WP9 TaxID=1500263 RepID=UPI000B8A2B5D|nr:acyl-CoA dehydrogenase family protein [Burkholderia sp. WP9]